MPIILTNKAVHQIVRGQVSARPCCSLQPLVHQAQTATTSPPCTLGLLCTDVPLARITPTCKCSPYLLKFWQLSLPPLHGCPPHPAWAPPGPSLCGHTLQVSILRPCGSRSKLLAGKCRQEGQIYCLLVHGGTCRGLARVAGIEIKKFKTVLKHLSF